MVFHIVRERAQRPPLQLKINLDDDVVQHNNPYVKITIFSESLFPSSTRILLERNKALKT
jgi:hypothetical protein